MDGKPLTHRQNKADGGLLYISLLRILAIFSIVLLNTANYDFYNCPVNSFAWQALNIYNSLGRFAVPVFVMIAGAYYLDPEKPITVKSLFKENLLKMALIYFFWSFVYAAVQMALQTGEIRVAGIGKLLRDTAAGPVHFWYIPMISGLFLITPFLRVVIEQVGKRMLEYFLLLSLVFAFGLSTLERLNFLPVVTQALNSFKLYYAAGYAGYFVLGYYLNRFELKKGYRIALYIAGILSLAVTILGTRVLSAQQGSVNDTLYNNLSPNYLVIGAALFVLFRKKTKTINFSERAVKTINILSCCAFGIYILHYFAFIFLRARDFHIIGYNPYMSVPAATVAIFLLCLAATCLLSKVPYVRKYLL